MAEVIKADGGGCQADAASAHRGVGPCPAHCATGGGGAERQGSIDTARGFLKGPEGSKAGGSRGAARLDPADPKAGKNLLEVFETKFEVKHQKPFKKRTPFAFIEPPLCQKFGRSLPIFLSVQPPSRIVQSHSFKTLKIGKHNLFSVSSFRAFLSAMILFNLFALDDFQYYILFILFESCKCFSRLGEK